MNGRFRGPGASSGPVRVHPRAAVATMALEAELEGALVDAVGGDPAGPALARRLERIAREILLRRGLASARVVARSDAAGTFVEVLMPPDGPRVQALVVRVGDGR